MIIFRTRLRSHLKYNFMINFPSSSKRFFKIEKLDIDIAFIVEGITSYVNFILNRIDNGFF